MTEAETRERIRRARAELEPLGKAHTWVNAILNRLVRAEAELAYKEPSVISFNHANRGEKANELYKRELVAAVELYRRPLWQSEAESAHEEPTHGPKGNAG
jgi:hypothetical protein